VQLLNKLLKLALPPFPHRKMRMVRQNTAHTHQIKNYRMSLLKVNISVGVHVMDLLKAYAVLNLLEIISNR